MDKNKKLDNNLIDKKAKIFTKDINLDNENSSFNNQSNLNNTNNNSNYEKSTKSNTI